MLFVVDTLCFDCETEINTYLQEHPELQKILVHTGSYYDIVDDTIYATKSTELSQIENRTIHLYLAYHQDQRPKIMTSAIFFLGNSLAYVIQRFCDLKSLPVPPDDIVLVAFGSSGRHSQASACDLRKSLHTLRIQNNDCLYFEPLIRSSPTITVYVFGPTQETKIPISCEKTAQIIYLLGECIKHFHLDSVRRECIQLRLQSNEITNEQLHLTFADLKIEDYSIFFLDIVKTSQTIDVNRDSKTADVNKLSPTSNANRDSSTVDVDTNDIPTNANRNSETNIDDKSNHVTINGKQQISTASLVITETVPSLSAQEQPSQASVRCYFPGEEVIELTVSLSETVGELTAKIAAKKEDQPWWQFDLRCNGADLENDDPDRRLSELGVKPNNYIYADMKPITPVSRPSTALTEQKSIVDHGTASTVTTYIRRRRPVGLRNLGNTCFMNSVLQCLSHVAPLRNFFLDSIHRAQTKSDFVNPFDSCGAVTGAFSEVISNLWKDSSYEFEPTRLKRVIGERVSRFACFDQQDAQEFMIFLLDALDKELMASNHLDQKASDIIERLFHGTMKTKMTCLECRHERETMNTIGFLPLPLSQQERVFAVHFASLDGHNHDVTYVPVINSGLIKHVVVNFVEQRPSVSADRIRVDSLEIEDELSFDMSLSTVLENELLFVELKRENDEWHKNPILLYPTEFPKDIIHCLEEFVALEMLNDPWYCQEKCNRPTKVAKQLQLQSLPPVLIIQLKRFAQNKGVRCKLDTHVEFPLDGLDLKQFLPPDTPPDKTTYDLIAVIDHIGSINGGHYTAYVRQQSETDQWYHISDSSVSRAYSSDIVSCNIYILFYLRRDQRTKT